MDYVSDVQLFDILQVINFGKSGAEELPYIQILGLREHKI
jgi:hypothetical protein